MKVLAAVSGGVDSAVATARLVDAGHDVTAVHLALSAKPRTHREGARGCCSLEDANDARRVADMLGVPFYVWDVAERFAEDVIDEFVAEYQAGRTPNPCLRCNERIKFAAVAERALALGFEKVATGHYARLIETSAGVALHRAVDEAKDQSYVLAGLTQEQLQAALFPLGDSTKDQIRAEAAQRGLLVASKPDSHDICFIPDGDTAAFLGDRLPVRSGVIEDSDGNEVGRHDGTWAFTVGQRRGLGLGRPGPDGRPRYVLDIEPAHNRVVVGSRAELAVDWVLGEQTRWFAPPDLPQRCAAQVRAHGRRIPAVLERADDRVEVQLLEPEYGVAPGQLIAFYDGDRVIGSARVSQTAAVATSA